MQGKILLLIFAYIVGSMPMGYWLVRWIKGVDVRTQGSGNIGMTNIWRVAGPWWGIATLAFDGLKGALAVGAARHFYPLDDFWVVLCGLIALFGNVCSMFLKFKGGKGIGISMGIFFSLLPLESSIALGLFLLALLITRMISVGSLLAVTALAALTAYYEKGLDWLSGLTLLAALLIWWTHRQNLKRILNGTENKIGGSKRKSR